jgi:hypothetical protein
MRGRTTRPAKTERWVDNRRQDGLRVARGIEGTWLIMTPQGASMAKCPCCDEPFKDPRIARYAADLVYPTARGEQ